MKGDEDGTKEVKGYREAAVLMIALGPEISSNIIKDCQKA